MAVEYKDYYDLLGIDRKASQKDIQKAFRKLAQKWHPDVNKSPNASEKFKEINEAYEVLKDPEKRRLYDSLGHNWQQGQNFRPPPGFDNVHFDFGSSGPSMGQGSGSFSDFFEMLFGAGLGPMGQGGRSAQRSSKTARPRGASSGFSGFQGFSPFGDDLSGGGFSNRRSRKPRDSEAEITVSLEDVYHGANKKMTFETPSGQKTYDVTIPAGISEGAKIRLSGQGAEGGNLLLKVNIAKHPKFEVKKHDLYVEVALAPWEAALGAKVEVATLDGPVMLTIPAGTQSGRRFRLKGKGLPKKKGKSGSLYVTAVIKLPKKLSNEEKKLFEQLAEVSNFNPRN